MNNDEKPITSRRERRLAQAARGDQPPAQLTPAQARAESEARAEAEARAAAEARARGVQSRGTRGGQEGSGGLDAGGSRSRRALDAPVDAVRSERSSQARARDREAHRVMRELAEKEQAARFPSRREIREQGQETPSVPPERPQSVQGPVAPPMPPVAPQTPPTSHEAVAPQRPASTPSSDIPAGSLPVVRPGAPERQRPAAAPSSSAPFREPVPTAPFKIPQNPAGEPVLGPETGSFRRLSHEQIAAARELLRAQAKTEAEARSRPRGSTPVDPETRKQQVAQAEREAVLSRRAQARQRLAEETKRDTETTRKTAPTSANNLAMVTPLEYVKVPGIPHPVMKPPTTHHVPVVTDRTPRQRGAAGIAPQEAAPIAAQSAHGLDPLEPQKSRVDRERVLLLGIGAIGIVALIAAVLIVFFGK